jgi:plastocyanin
MSIAKLAWVSAAVGLLVAGVAMAGAVQDKMVEIMEKGFSPDKVEIVMHQKVIFMNATKKDHTLVSKNPAGLSDQDKDKTGFDSGVIKPGMSWEHMFSAEGTYTYYCKEDKAMIGTIVVRPAK